MQPEVISSNIITNHSNIVCTSHNVSSLSMFPMMLFKARNKIMPFSVLIKSKFYKCLLRPSFPPHHSSVFLYNFAPLLTWFLASCCTLTPLGTPLHLLSSLDIHMKVLTLQVIHTWFSTNSLLSHHSLNFITLFSISCTYFLILIFRLTCKHLFSSILV